jgi:hypothetical protein
MATKLYILNDTVYEVQGLANGITGAYVNDATVSVTVKNLAGTTVSGISFPVTLAYVAESDGVYRGVSDKAMTLSDTLTYFAEITATNGDGLDGFWRVPCVGAYRET